MIKNVTIIGSGLSGPLLSIFLAKYFKISSVLYERNKDCRLHNKFSGRSINLALSQRGINALQNADIFDENFNKLLIPMYGRMIHDINGTQTLQPYSNKKKDCINSVSRAEINKILLNKAEETKKVKIAFSSECKKIDFKEGLITINKKNISINHPVFGTDGYKSIIAKEINKKHNNPIIYNDIDHSYKELTISSKNNDFQLNPNALHIWPRHDLMLIALPNQDKSFTCTLFMKNNGTPSFKTINNQKSIMSFFETNFNDILPLIKNLSEQFLANPVGKLISINNSNWHYKDKACVLGDAAHAIVPFYGQGMNASFEDCIKLCKIIKETQSWADIFHSFQKERKKDTDAISDLSFNNYNIMKNEVLNKEHEIKKELSFKLNEMFPNYFIPEYSMISFTNIPYLEARRRGKIQDKILDKILLKMGNLTNLNKQELSKLIKPNLKRIDYEKFN